MSTTGTDSRGEQDTPATGTPPRRDDRDDSAAAIAARSDRRWHDGIAAALDRAAEQDAALLDRVARYDDATADLLAAIERDDTTADLLAAIERADSAGLLAALDLDQPGGDDDGDGGRP